MLEEAFAKVPMVEPKDAMKWLTDSDTIFVDVRDTLIYTGYWESERSHPC